MTFAATVTIVVGSEAGKRPNAPAVTAGGNPEVLTVAGTGNDTRVDTEVDPVTEIVTEVRKPSSGRLCPSFVQ